MESTIRETEVYGKLVGLRTIVKAIQQFSWDTNMIDKRYPLDSLTIDEMNDLIEIYHQMLTKLKRQMDGIE